MGSLDIKNEDEASDDYLEPDVELFNRETSIQSILLKTELLSSDKIHIHYDETLKLLPSTALPLYNLEKELSSFGIEKFGPTKKRFLVIIIASTASFLQIFSQCIWSAIYEPALAAFPNWSSRSLALLPIWGSIMTAVLVFPACLTINKYGLKLSLLWSCCFLTLGSAVRCLPSVYSSTMFIHLSSICLAAGGVAMTPLIITVSAQWFPKNERTMATGFGSAMGMLGSAATYIVGSMIVSTDSEGSLNPIVLRIRIMSLLYTCFGLNVLVTLLVYLIFPSHTQPMSHVSKQAMASHQSAKVYCSLKILFLDFDVWCLVLAFALSNTMLAPWTGLLPSTFSKLHVPPELSSNMGFYMIIHTFFLSLTISTFAYRAPGYSKEFTLFSRLISLVFLFWLMLMLNFGARMTTTTLVCVVLMAFPYGWCSQSLLYEMGAQLMYPLPESFVAGYMTLLNNLFVDFVYGVIFFFPSFEVKELST
ncbi:Major facilitator superfamily,Major facilitator superfamily domain [Cinara cedri]|uniref:Major facilitator superfamily,Major facilitator superfamily domain n=1 Tax=Cinara cedri TaxID=506608 RepID=A0A5E4M3X5_9HEMI|nr:Major facilitator superfamily,Major facilitator superfamily domain [Cinara cedri]